MKNWRTVFLFSLLLGFLFMISSAQIVFAQNEIELPLAYPEAVAREKTPYQSIWNDEPGAPSCLTIRYDVEVLSNVIARWYFEKLTQAGWKYEGEFNEQNYYHLFSKDNQEIKIVLRPGGPNIIGVPPNGTLIFFSWREVGESKTSPNLASEETEQMLPLYPGAKRFYRKEEIILNKSIDGWPNSLCTWKTFTVANVSEETVSKWYYDTLTSAGWQFGKTKKNYDWEPKASFTSISPQFYLKGEEIIQFFFQRGGPKYDVDYNGVVFDYCLSTVKKTESTPIPSPQPVSYENEMNLKTLMSNYYYFRHLANQRMGWHFWDWGLKAVFPKAVKAIKRLFTILTDPRKIFAYLAGMGELVEKIEKTKEGLGNFLQMVWRKDWLAATCLVGSLAAEERDADPLGALLFGGAYTECMIKRAKDYYAKTLEKLKAEDPSYCVFQEICAGQSRCYKNWFSYWQAFRPEGDFTPLPRGEVATKKAEELWLEKTKFGEFSDGKKYTVKEITGEDWQDAFEDVSWPERRIKVPFLSPKEKEEDPCNETT